MLRLEWFSSTSLNKTISIFRFSGLCGLTLSSLFFLVFFAQKRVFMKTTCSPTDPPIDLQNVKNWHPPPTTNMPTRKGSEPTNLIRDEISSPPQHPVFTGLKARRYHSISTHVRSTILRFFQLIMSSSLERHTVLFFARFTHSSPRHRTTASSHLHTLKRRP